MAYRWALCFSWLPTVPVLPGQETPHRINTSSSASNFTADPSDPVRDDAGANFDAYDFRTPAYCAIGQLSQVIERIMEEDRVPSAGRALRKNRLRFIPPSFLCLVQSQVHCAYC